MQISAITAIKRIAAGLLLLCASLTTAADQGSKTAPISKRQGTGASPAVNDLSPLVQQAGGVLRLPMLDGRVVELVDVKPDPKMKNVDSVVAYTFVRHIKDIDYFLILKTYYEGFGHLLVNRATGAMSNIDAEPEFSPKNTRFVTVSLCDAYCTQGIKIWRLTKENIKEEVWFHPSEFVPGESWGRAGIQWVDEVTLRIKSDNVRRCDKDVEGMTYTLKLTPTGWKILDTEEFRNRRRAQTSC